MRYTIEIPHELGCFYGKVAEQIGLPVEQVLADALYKLAGELSLHALHNAKSKESLS